VVLHWVCSQHEDRMYRIPYSNPVVVVIRDNESIALALDGVWSRDRQELNSDMVEW